MEHISHIQVYESCDSQSENSGSLRSTSVNMRTKKNTMEGRMGGLTCVYCFYQFCFLPENRSSRNDISGAAVCSV